MPDLYVKLSPMSLILLLIVFFTAWDSAIAEERLELNTVLMESTFKIEGDNSVGTAFIVGRPSERDTAIAYYVLVTAAHVLNDIESDSARITLRVKDSDGTYERFPYWIRIRHNNRPIYVCHDEVDVAAMYIGLPKKVSIPLLTTDFLADDHEYSEFDIHPGDRLMCLGYPLGAEANDIGFPILRSGIIASYPIFPVKYTRTLLYDVEIFKGNSGGPVYFAESGRTYKGALHAATIQFIVGLISKERLMIEALPSQYKLTVEQTRLGLAEVVHAIYIKETIEKLPKIE
jgi:hypothetical protein